MSTPVSSGSQPISLHVAGLTGSITADRKTASIHAMSGPPLWQGTPRELRLIAAAAEKLVELYDLDTGGPWIGQLVAAPEDTRAP